MRVQRAQHREHPATRWLASLVALIALATSFPAVVAAADVAVRAELDRPQVAVGESADLAVVVQGVQDAAAPTIADVDGLSVRYVGPATQLSIVNGRASASITHHFSVSATKPGTFTIGPIAVEYGGKRYDAGTLTLAAGGAPAGGATAGGAVPGGGTAAGARRGAPATDQVTLVLASPRTRAFLHERVPATLTLTVGAVQVSDVHYPTIGGDAFAIEPLREPVQRREQTAHGVAQVVDFHTVLTPLRAGDLTIGPATIELSVPVRGRSRDPVFDRFFGGDPFGALRQITVQSEPLHLDVLPLPDAGKPADFSGAVGSFDLHVAASPRELKAGDPVTITTTIAGDGNLDGITAPVVAAGDALKTYPVQPVPQPSSNPNAARGRARVAFEQVVIPPRAGSFTLAAPRFSYFDPGTGTYRTLTAPPIALTVQASAQPAAQAPVGALPAATPAPAAAPETLGRDIVFIKDTPGALTPIGRRLYRSPTFWALQLVPLALWAAVAAYDRRRKLLRADPRLARFAGAGRSARRAIAGAETALRAGDRAAFYDGLAAALREYLSAKLDLPPGAITADGVAEHVRARGVSPDVTAGLHELLETCERVRFAPQAAADGDMRHALDRAASLVRSLERERRLSSASARVALVLAIGAAATRTLVVLALIAAVLAPRWLRADVAPSPNTIFFHANALYGEERYTDAAAEYERVLAAGVESGPLYFNLGNAYFKTGDIGRSVLAYERARRLMPADPDLHANLRFAREGAEPDAPALVARILFPLATRLASDTLLRLASGLWMLVMLLAITRRLVPALDAVGRRAVVVASALLVVVATSAAYRVLAIDLPSWAVVVARQGATVRFEPSESGTAHFTVPTGAKLRVLSSREQWSQVERTDGTRGWIAADAIGRL